jgi:predicted CopG family antitoxin
VAVKTVTLRLEAYERLRAARSYPGESFSQVILRATWPERSITAGELLARYRVEGPHLTDDELDAIEDVMRTDALPTDKWTTR